VLEDIHATTALPGTGVVVHRSDDPGWLRFVQEHAAATPFHHPAWSAAVAATYGYPSFVLALRAEDGCLLAGMPVMEVRNPLGRPRLVSLPFTDYCPPLVREGEDVGRFVEALSQRRSSGDDLAIEVRGALPLGSRSHQRVIGTRHLIDLERDPDAVYRRFDGSRVRKRIASARALGVTVTLERSRDALATFYGLHCETRRRLGVPVQPGRFFDHIWQYMLEPDLGFVAVARAGQKPIGAALFLAWNRHLIYKYSASDRRQLNLRPNLMVLWAAMEWGCRNGYRSFDMGRTDAGNESLRVFKAGWGSTEVPLVYTQLGRSIPPRGHSGASRGLALLIRYSPTIVCRAVGELLYRYAA
jgi:CelD/BcsL family acetyltransferase involved in cellulose biosynthesis